MHNTLCSLVLHLYKGSREQAATRFTGWALDRARAMIHFDSALWAIGTPGERIHSAHYYQLPGTMLREWERQGKKKEVAPKPETFAKEYRQRAADRVRGYLILDAIGNHDKQDVEILVIVVLVP